MDQSAPAVETELVDLSGVPLAALGSLNSVGLSEAARRLLALTENPPTLGAAQQSGC